VQELSETSRGEGGFRYRSEVVLKFSDKTQNFEIEIKIKLK
jgi:hypothetical protein